MKIPTAKENLANLKRCPKFDECNINLCPLDFWMSERIELPEDTRCPLRGYRTKRTEGRKSATLRGISRFIWKKNESSDKTAIKKGG